VAVIDHSQRSVEIDKHKTDPMVTRDGGQLPAVVSFQQQVVLGQGLASSQDRTHFPCGAMPRTKPYPAAAAEPGGIRCRWAR